jgi:hypothetical protein
MTKPHDDLAQDLAALRYLDALNAGDLEAVAALWEQASRDPQLERALAELDGALFLENATAQGKAGGQSVPGSLPRQLPARRRRWAGWVGAAGALAAACVLAVLATSRRDGKMPETSPATTASARQLPRHAPDDFASTPAWPEIRRLVDGAETPTFHWPLPEGSPTAPSTSIPPDLLD